MYNIILKLLSDNLSVVSPMTNDSANFVWLIPVAAVSLILVVLLVVLGKKRK